MRHILLLATVALLLVGAWAWADEPVPAPSPPPAGPDATGPKSCCPGHESWKDRRHGVVDLGFYLGIFGEPRLYDLTRLNHKLADADLEPFSSFVNDVNFAVGIVAPSIGFWELAGGFWGQSTGGSEITDAQISGYDVVMRFGPSLLDSKRVQLYFQGGIGYSAQVITVKGDLDRFEFDDLPPDGTVDLRRAAMLLEAGLRVDMLMAVPRETTGAFLSLISLSLGYQNTGVGSRWANGTDTVYHVPYPFDHALFARVGIGFGGGVRMPPKAAPEKK